MTDVQDLNDRKRAGTLPTSTEREEKPAGRLRVAGGEEKPSPLVATHAERAILAAIMWSALYDGGALRPANIVDLCDPEMFAEGMARAVATEMWGCETDKQPCAPVTLHGRLVQAGCSREVGGLEALERLVESATPTTPAQLRSYAEIVRDAWARREIIGHGRQLADKLSTGTASVASAIAQMRANVDRIDRAIASESGIVSAKDAARQLADNMQKGKPLGIPTGFHGFDTYFGGLVPCDVTLIAARTSVGKSAFTYQLLEGAAALTADFAAQYISMEMPPRDFITRAAASKASVDIDRIRQHLLTPEDAARLAPAIVDVGAKPIWFNDKQTQTMPSIARLVEKTATAAMRAGRKLRVVVIDHVLLVSRSKREGAREMADFMAEVSGWMKRMATHYEVAVLGLAQISRDAEKQPGKSKRPKLHQLRWGSSFEENTDNVAIIHRERRKDGGGFVPGPAEVLVEKNRMGKLGVYKMNVEPNYARFSNLDETAPGKEPEKRFVDKESTDDGVPWPKKKVDWQATPAARAAEDEEPEAPPGFFDDMLGGPS